MDMAFASAKSGLVAPTPGGLPGFQRQGMNQTKKSAGSLWQDYAAHRAEITDGPNGYAGALWDGAIMRWMDAAFAVQLTENQPSVGPIWAMHMLPDVNTANGGAMTGERGAAGGSPNSIPLTNGLDTAYVHLIWPSPRSARSWRGHNLGGDWGSSRVPVATSLEAKDAATGRWVVLDAGPAIPNLTGDTGYRSVPTAVFAVEHRLKLIGNGSTTSAQSLCFLDIVF